MTQTNPPHGSDHDEKPQAMLFDGWGFVPIPETEALIPRAEAQPDLPEKAAA